MASKTFVLMDGTEMSPEETIVLLLQKAEESRLKIIEFRKELNRLNQQITHHTTNHV